MYKRAEPMHRTLLDLASPILVLSVVMFTALAPAAVAQPATGIPEETRREAATRYERGLSLFAEGRHDAALAEFEYTYRITHEFRVLNNLGRVHAALGHSVEAADALERYLTEGGTNIQRRERRELEAMIAEQRSRVAELTVTVNVDGAVISVDGNDVSRAPLTAPLRLSAGAHTVGARAPGYDSAQRAIQLAGLVRESISFELRPTDVALGHLRINCNLPGVAILIDDAPHTEPTPLSSTIPLAPGTHRIRANRTGYRSVEQSVEIRQGAEAEASVQMTADENAPPSTLGNLRIRLPHGERRLLVDGHELTQRLERYPLPIGAHDVRIEMTDREPYRSTVTIASESVADLTPELRWTPDARQARIDGAGSQRTLGTVFAIAGGVLLAAGAGLEIWNETELSSAQSNPIRRVTPAQITAYCMTAAPRNVPQCVQNLPEQRTALENDINSRETMRWVYIGGGALGLIGLVAGTIMLTGAPSESDIDRGAHASGPTLNLGLGFNAVHLHGTF